MFIELQKLLKEHNMSLDDLLFSVLEKIVAWDGLYEISILASLLPLENRDYRRAHALVSSFISFLSYLGILEISDNTIRLTSKGKELWRALNPKRRGIIIIELLASKASGFIRLLKSLNKVGRISKNRIRIYRDLFSSDWDLITIGILWLESYGVIISGEGEDYMLTGIGSSFLSEIQMISKGPKDIEKSLRGTLCEYFNSYLEPYLKFRESREYSELVQKKEYLMNLVAKLADLSFLNQAGDEEFREILSGIIARGMNPEELEREALRSFLLKELRKVRAEAEAIMSRYGVRSIEELDEKVRKGELRETDVLEDLMRLDYLLDREERLRELLKEMEG